MTWSPKVIPTIWLPIILTASHGGTLKPDDVRQPRQASKSYKNKAIETFKTEWDSNSLEFVFRLAERLYRSIGKRPYIVAARFDRQYVDANRNKKLLGPAELEYENHAYDDPAAQLYYDQYHYKVKEFVDEIRNRFRGRGLLFDIHGTILQDKRIVVGMVTYDSIDFQKFFRRGHVSVDALLSRFGFDPLYHPMCGFFSALHGRTLPGGIKTEVTPIERFQRASPSGGYTVMTYGSNRPGGIDSFQLECSTSLYTQWLETSVEIYADAVQALYRNVIEDPYCLETVFAGKQQFGERHKNGKAYIFEFDLAHTPRKNYPAVVLIHNRRVVSILNKVTLNGLFLGNLKKASPVSCFEISKEVTGRLRKRKNQLIIMAASQNPEKDTEIDDFDIVKINVTYCGI